MNLVMGSLFNSKILDLFEFEVLNFINIEHFKKDVKIDSGMKPIVIFQGDVFETDFQYDRMRKFFLDYFRIHDIEDVSVSELKRVMIISSGEDKEIKIRSYQVEGGINEYLVKESVKLTEVGPSLNLKVRRIQLGTEEFYKLSLKQPRETNPRPKKNIETNSLGEVRGRVHLQKQNLNAMHTKSYKRILGRKRFNKKDDDSKPEGEGDKAQKKNGRDSSEKGDKKKSSRGGKGKPIKKQKTDFDL